jgi:hypothetical protein
LRKWSFLPLADAPAAADPRRMTFLIALAIVAAGAATLLTFAGRESVRLQGRPPLPVRSPAELLHLMEIGYRALDHASREAARLRMSRGW